MILVGRLAVSSREVWSGVISTFVVVVFDVKVDQFAEVYPQSTA